MRKVKSAAGEEEMYNYPMSPRYFAKFTGNNDHNAGNWFHFTPSDYKKDSPEFKVHIFKIRVYLLIKKIFRLK